MILLRPWALLLLLIPFILKGIRHLTHTQTPWHKFIDSKLLAALLVKEKVGKMERLWSWPILVLWSIWCVALAGPAFYKLPVPAVESAPNTVVVFDLSMQGKELLQGQAKLYDLLSALQGERVGLVVFGQNQGYTAMPLTPDISLVKEVVPTLGSDVLPEPATNPKAGFNYAARLLDRSGATGRILYVTDKAIKWGGKYPFGVLNLKERTADNGDIQALLKATQKAETSRTENTFSTSADVWADLGGVFVLGSLPLLAWMFKKGILFLILFCLSIQSEAGFLWRPEQEVYRLEKEAVKAYDKRNYQEAKDLFQKSGNLYNRGNALAFSGDIQGAIEAYTEALKQNPQNADAKFNKEYLEKQLPPPEEQAKQNEEGQSDENKNQSDENSEQNQNDNQQNKDEEQSNQEQNNQGKSDLDSEEEKEENSEPTQEETEQELEQALAEYDKENTFNQEEQQIINRLNHDPSRVLRYRLMLQHQKGIVK